MAKLFTTTSDYLNVAAAVLTAPALTLHVWAKHTALGSIENLLSLGTTGSGNNRYYISKTADDQTHAIERDTTSGQANSANLSDTAWHAYTAVFTSHSSRDAYLDGGSKGSSTTTHTCGVPDCLFLGRSQAGSTSNFAGKLAYAAIWNRVLTALEISNLAVMTPLAAAPSGLVAYYILLSDALDTAGANNLTVNGSAGYDTDMPSLGGILPSAAALTVAGQIPTLAKQLVVAPGVGAITIAGAAPTLLGNIMVVSPGVGIAVMAGRVPTAQHATGPSGAPDVGVLSILGRAPTLKTLLIVVPDVNTSSADEVGLAPTIILGGSYVPDVGAISIAGKVPSLDKALTVTPGVGAIGLTTGAVTVQAAIMSVSPAPAALSMSGLVPLVIAGGSLTVDPLPGALNIAGGIPGLVQSVPVEATPLPDAGQVQMLGLAPDVLSSLIVTPDAGVIFAFGRAPVGEDVLLWHDPALGPVDPFWHAGQ